MQDIWKIFENNNTWKAVGASIALVLTYIGRQFLKPLFRLDFKCLERENLFASRWQGRISCVCEGNWLLILDFPGIDAPQIQDSSCVCVWLPLDLASRSTFPLYQSVSQRSRHQPLQLKTPEAFMFSLWPSGFPWGWYLSIHSLGMIFVNTLPWDDIHQYTHY